MTEAAQPVRMFRKGLSLKNEVADELTAHYHSALVDEVRAAGYQRRTGRLHLYLASEFGFCYGVDRAVDYAYQARRRFPDRSIHLTGEIIHNPRVNDRLRAAGIRFLSDPGEDERALGPDDVVILPAFGVTVSMLLRLQQRGCTLVDTTCGSVLNVWKNVRRYARDGFTAIIHGKVRHEETVATASRRCSTRTGAPSSCSTAPRPASCATSSGAAATLPPFWRSSAAPRRPDSTPAGTCSASVWPTRPRC